MRRLTLVAVMLAMLLPVASHALDWGAIVPAQSTLDSVRAQYGEPSRRSTSKIDGYDTTEWAYEGDRAPGGLRRIVIAFGLLTPQGFRPELVRAIRLTPLPGIFTQANVVIGWGEPSAIGRDGEAPAMLYDQGLIVRFEDDGLTVKEMVFMPPQQKPAR